MEKLYVIFVMIFTMSPFTGLSPDSIELPEQSSGTIGQLSIQIITYLPIVILIPRHWRSFLGGLIDCKWAIAMLMLAVSSGLWAADPLFVFRKSMVLAANMVFAIYFGTRYARDEQIRILFYTITLIIALSLLAVIFFPQYGIDHVTHMGAWRGFFSEKNELGRLLVLYILVFCLMSLEWTHSEILRFLCIAGCGVLIILSQSTTAAVVGSVLLALILVYRSLRSRFQALTVVMALLVFSIIVAVAVGYSELLFSLANQDELFTGRGGLWIAVLNAISRKPLLGYGFMSFWNGLAGPSASVIDAVVGWVPPHAHNGFLDLWLDLGAIGLITFTIGFVLRFRTAILEYRNLGSQTALWPLGYLSFLLLYNFTESSLLRINFILWNLYVVSLIRDINCGRSSE